MPPVIKKRKPVLPLSASMDKVEETIIEIADKRKQKDALESRIKEAQSELLDLLEQSGKGDPGEKYSVDHQGRTLTAAVMQNTARVIDDEKLKRKVGPSIWRRITTLSFDKTKADSLVKTGEIDEVDYADCVIETPGAKYVKVATK